MSTYLTRRLKKMETRHKPNWTPPEFDIIFVNGAKNVESSLRVENGGPIWRTFPDPIPLALYKIGHRG